MYALMYPRIGVCILETVWEKKTQTIAQLFWTRRDQGVKSLLATRNSTDGMWPGARPLVGRVFSDSWEVVDHVWCVCANRTCCDFNVKTVNAFFPTRKWKQSFRLRKTSILQYSSKPPTNSFSQIFSRHLFTASKLKITQMWRSKRK